MCLSLAGASLGPWTERFFRVICATMAAAKQYLGLAASLGFVAALTTMTRLDVAGAQSSAAGTSRLAVSAPHGKASDEALRLLAGKIEAAANDVAFAILDAPTTSKDEQPAGLVASAPMVLLGRPTLAASDASELLAWMKATGTALKIGHGGGLSATHACALQVQIVVGIQATLVAAPVGTTPLSLLRSGAVDIVCEAIPVAMADITAGTINAYILAAEERVAGLWDLPTADQVGVPLFSASVWLGLYGPTDPDNRTRLNMALQAALSDAMIAQRLADAGWTPFPLTHRSVAAHVDYAASDAERMKTLFEIAGVAKPIP